MFILKYVICMIANSIFIIMIVLFQIKNEVKLRNLKKVNLKIVVSLDFLLQPNCVIGLAS